MSNPSNNKTTGERAREGLIDVYVLPADLVCGSTRSRFWFRNDRDRKEFMTIFNRLQQQWGYSQQYVEIPPAKGTKS